MIFATVGTQLPFDRLIRALDAWAEANPQEEVFAQIGNTTYEPRFVSWQRTITQDEFRSYMADCRVTVAHAGMGTIISAVELGKPVIVMPRQAKFNEHRNDHQLATVSRLSHLNGLEVVNTDDELVSALTDIAAADGAAASATARSLPVAGGLIAEIRSFAGLEAGPV